jgi:hypothetical protein
MSASMQYFFLSQFASIPTFEDATNHSNYYKVLRFRALLWALMLALTLA